MIKKDHKNLETRFIIVQSGETVGAVSGKLQADTRFVVVDLGNIAANQQRYRVMVAWVLKRLSNSKTIADDLPGFRETRILPSSTDIDVAKGLAVNHPLVSFLVLDKNEKPLGVFVFTEAELSMDIPGPTVTFECDCPTCKTVTLCDLTKTEFVCDNTAPYPKGTIILSPFLSSSHV